MDSFLFSTFNSLDHPALKYTHNRQLKRGRDFKKRYSPQRNLLKFGNKNFISVLHPLCQAFKTAKYLPFICAQIIYFKILPLQCFRDCSLKSCINSFHLVGLKLQITNSVILHQSKLLSLKGAQAGITTMFVMNGA